MSPFTSLPADYGLVRESVFPPPENGPDWGRIFTFDSAEKVG